MIDPSTNRLNIPHIYNARDMGGMPTAKGRLTKYKNFIRSDSPSFLDSSGVESLYDYGVRTVIDLRSEVEVERNGNPFIAHPNVSFHNIPLIAADPDDLSDPTMDYLVKNNLGDLYILMFEHSRESIRRVFDVISRAPDGVILFHCMHGKDRTGLIAALLYLLAEVTNKDIIENYASSFSYIRPLVDPLFKIAPKHAHHLYRSDAANMEKLLAHIDNKYNGNLRQYLYEIGLKNQEIDQIYHRLV